MKILYLDESGVSNLASVDKTYPVFVLGGVLVDEHDLKYNDKLMSEFKKKYFCSGKIILHWSEIDRNYGDFAMLNDIKKKRKFLKDINALLKIMRYRVIVCLIDKVKWLQEHKDHAFDPYEHSLGILIEHAIQATEFGEKIIVNAEKRDKISDTQIRLTFEKIRNMGWNFGRIYISSGKIKAKIKKLDFNKKEDNITGAQIADLVLPPFAKNYLGKDSKIRYEIVYEKCLDYNGKKDGCGKTVLPKKVRAKSGHPALPYGRILSHYDAKVKKKVRKNGRN